MMVMEMVMIMVMQYDNAPTAKNDDDDDDALKMAIIMVRTSVWMKEDADALYGAGDDVDDEYSDAVMLIVMMMRIVMTLMLQVTTPSLRYSPVADA